MTTAIRNIAIIAHVDHGKTTLIDRLLQSSGTLSSRHQGERVMDSNEIEQERGITILAKTTAIHWNDYHINIVDTPGHAAFGGEVERVLSMVDSVLLIVDAVDGPMPQTRFVTQKAFKHNLKPILVINKIDRDGARPDWVADQVFDLFDKLGATDEQLDFPIIYTSAINNIATDDYTNLKPGMDDLFQLIVDAVPPPDVDPDAPFQMQISTLDYSTYVGTIGIGRVTRGKATTNMPVVDIHRDGSKTSGRLLQVYTHLGLERQEVPEVCAGDIVCVTGIADLKISDTLCDPNHLDALPALTVDEPTITMFFCVNNSPFAGQDGKYLTSRQILERLQRETVHNVALRVEETENPDQFRVCGRGELHLGILLENMRREGYELGVSRPEVIFKTIDEVVCEPFEFVNIDIDQAHQGTIMEQMGNRQGKLQDMVPDDTGRVRLTYIAPSRGLIGFHSEFVMSTSGTGIITHVFDHYAPKLTMQFPSRHRGALIANMAGKALAYSLFNLQERGQLLLGHGVPVYEGMIVGFHNRDNDLVVNVTKAKQLTNIRAAGTDEALILTPPLKLSLEQALEYINDDELVEITPNHIRLRKKILSESDRKRLKRGL